MYLFLWVMDGYIGYRYIQGIHEGYIGIMCAT